MDAFMTMDAFMNVGPLEPSYPDPENILETFCGLCGSLSIEYCFCTQALVTAHTLHFPTFTEDTFRNHPEWPREDSMFDVDLEPDFTTEDIPNVYHDQERLLLNNDIIRGLDDDATTVLPSTIQRHIEDTYLPGDRLEAESKSGSRRQPHRRQPHRRQVPRHGGFPCTQQKCGKAFNRSCDLKRHQKTHLDRSERPHKCNYCPEGFLYPKDRNRHERIHEQSSTPQAMLHCNIPGCQNIDGFSRRDNLLRHQRNKHPPFVPSS